MPTRVSAPDASEEEVHIRRNRAWRALTTALVVLAAAVLMVVAPGSASAAPDCNSPPGVAEPVLLANIAVDGDFGPKTKQALRNAQMMMNSRYDPDIAVDGRYGPQTRRGGFAFAVFTSYGGGQVKQDGYCYYKIDP